MLQEQCRTHNQDYCYVCETHENCDMKFMCSQCLQIHSENVSSLKIRPMKQYRDEQIHSELQTKANKLKIELVQNTEQTGQKLIKQFKLLNKKITPQLDRLDQVINQKINSLNKQEIQKLELQIKLEQSRCDEFEKIKVELDKIFAQAQVIQNSISEIVKSFKKEQIINTYIYQGNQVWLKGKVIADVKDGYFKYQYHYQSEEYAGQYFLNDKIGIWKEFVENNGSMIPTYIEYRGGRKTKQYPENSYFIFQNNEWQLINKVDNQNEKTGLWREQSNNIIEEGQYNQNFRIGKWKILFENKQIGGGEYDDGEIKVGAWKEPYQNNPYIIYEGIYKNNNMKSGLWKILFRKNNNETFQEMYKCSMIIEAIQIIMTMNGEQKIIEDNFNINNQIIWQGKCQQNLRIGEWKIYFLSQRQNILELVGGGKYDEQGLKQGIWVEPCVDYQNNRQIGRGKYENNEKLQGWSYGAISGTIYRS